MDDKTLLEAINQAVVDKTMSLDGLKAVQELKSRLETSDKILVEVKRDRDRYENHLANERLITKNLKEQVAALEGKIAVLQHREEGVARALMCAEFSELRRQDVFSLVQTIFKNPVVKTSIREDKSVPTVTQGQYPGAYPQTTYNTETTNTTKTEEIG